MKTPLITIILPIYNGKRFLRPLIDSILLQSVKDIGLLAIDDSSTDGSFDFIKNSFDDKRITLIRNKKNIGYAGSVNKAYQTVKSPYVMVINQDMRFLKETLSDLLKSLSVSDDIAAVIPVQYRNKEDIKRLSDMIYKKKAVPYLSIVGNDIGGVAEFHPKDNDLARMFYCNIFLAKTSHIGKDIFDKDFYMYCEDMYLGWKFNIKGYSVYINPKINMWHYCGYSKELDYAVNLKASFHGAKNKIMNLLIFYDYINFIRIFPLLFLSEFLYLFYEPKKIFVKLKAHIWIITHLPLIMKKHKDMKKHKIVQDKELFKFMSYKIYEEGLFNNIIIRYLIHSVNLISFIYTKIFFIKTKDN